MSRPTLARRQSRAELLALGRERLAGIDSARLDAEILLCEALSLPRTALYAAPEAEVGPEGLARFLKHIAERERGRPVAYVLGRREFWSLDLTINEHVLVPRPETELLVETALAHLAGLQAPVVVDLGTGSGAIALAIASERPDAHVTATDTSAEALAVAALNARRLGLRNVTFKRGEWLQALPGQAADLIVSNPPYLHEDDPLLEEAPLAFEPRAALAAGPEGLDALAQIIAAAPDCLRSGGRVLLEHGAGQGEAVRALLVAAGFDGVRTLRDLAGHERASEGFVATAPL